MAVMVSQEYFDRTQEVKNSVGLSKATVTRVQVAGMGDRVCVDLCSIMLPGEGLLVGLAEKIVFCQNHVQLISFFLLPVDFCRLGPSPEACF